MKLETAQRSLVYRESIWGVKEIDLIEDKRKLQLRIGMIRTEFFLTHSYIGAGNGGHAERA